DGDKMGFPVFPLEWKTADGDVYSGYREDGYLAEAVINMLAFLGWNPGTEQELFSLEELVQAFDLDRVNKAGAKFDPEKTKWFQHHYLQEVDNGILAGQFKELLKNKGIETSLPIETITALLKERATFVEDIWDQGSFFFEAPESYDEKAAKKAFKEGTAEILQQVISLMKEVEDFSAANVSDKVKGWITDNEIGFGKVMMPLRLSLVGEMKGPDVFVIASLLGKEESIKRIEKAIKSI
ncbi:MAG TPA: glutamate--tRNA ligase, partial [Flavobacteriaceae bacterium]|nr:glutamate--tRNA ligase [Flavobacteriaceae bacterium]